MARPPKHSPQRLTGLFLDMLAAERGAGPNTLEAYTRDLDDLAAYLAAAKTTIATATTADLRAYLGTLAARGFKASSVARRLSAVRQLYRFLYAEGHRRDDPAAVIEGPKRGRVLPKVLSIAEVDRLLAAAHAGANDAARPPTERLRALRLACLLEVLYATGLRVSELIALPASAARRDERMLVVRGKGGKERLVPLNQAAKTTMRAYLDRLAEGERRATRRAACGLEMAVPVLRRERPPHPPARRARTQEPGGRRRHRARAREPACAAPRLREPSAAERRRSARGADPARSCRHLDHADLHPRARRAAQEPGARPASAGGGEAARIRTAFA